MPAHFNRLCTLVATIFYLLFNPSTANAQTCTFDLEKLWPYAIKPIFAEKEGDKIWEELKTKILASPVIGAQSAGVVRSGSSIENRTLRLARVVIGQTKGFCKEGYQDNNEAVIEVLIETPIVVSNERFPSVSFFTIGFKADRRDIENSNQIAVGLCHGGWNREISDTNADRAGRMRGCAQGSRPRPQACISRPNCGLASDTFAIAPSSLPSGASTRFKDEPRRKGYGALLLPLSPGFNFNGARDDDLAPFFKSADFPLSLAKFGATHIRSDSHNVIEATGVFLSVGANPNEGGVVEGYLGFEQLTSSSRWRPSSYSMYYRVEAKPRSAGFTAANTPVGEFDVILCRIYDFDARIALNLSSVNEDTIKILSISDVKNYAKDRCKPVSVSCDTNGCFKGDGMRTLAIKIHNRVGAVGIDATWPTDLRKLVSLEIENKRQQAERDALRQRDNEEAAQRAKEQAERNAIIQARENKIRAEQDEIQRREYEAKRTKDEAAFNTLLRSPSPRTMYLAAVNLEDTGDRGKAKTVYREMIKRFPNSQEALLASQRLTRLSDVEAVESSNSNASSRAESAAQGLRTQNYEQCKGEEISCYSRCDQIKNSSAQSSCKSSCFKGCQR